MIGQVEEKLLVPNNFPAPGGAVQALELLEFLLWKIQSIPVDVFVARPPATAASLPWFSRSTRLILPNFPANVKLLKGGAGQSFERTKMTK